MHLSKPPTWFRRTPVASPSSNTGSISERHRLNLVLHVPTYATANIVHPYLFGGRDVVQNGVDGLLRVVSGDSTSDVRQELLVPVHHLWKVGLQG